MNNLKKKKEEKVFLKIKKEKKKEDKVPQNIYSQKNTHFRDIVIIMTLFFSSYS